MLDDSLEPVQNGLEEYPCRRLGGKVKMNTTTLDVGIRSLLDYLDEVAFDQNCSSMGLWVDRGSARMHA
jgi:hypothetical protein